MPREIYPEQKMLPIPDTLRLCERCKVALIYKPFNSPPKCDKCGDTGREGELYVRVGSLQEAMKKANWTRERIGAVSTLVQALELTK